jgi:site-specific DNA-cytosine methylase
MGSGMPGVADYRAITNVPAYGHTPMGQGKGADMVQDTDDASACVTGDPRPGKAGAASIVAEHRFAHAPRDGSHQVGDTSSSCGPVIGAASVTSSNGLGAVAEYRQRQGKECFGNVLKMTSWEEVAAAATAALGPNQSANLVADPRPTCEMRNGTAGVCEWDEVAAAVIGAADIHNGGASAVAQPISPGWPAGAVWDCRIPDDDEQGVWYIISPHRDKKGRRCWHRALSTWELLALQSFPTRRKDGRAVVLASKTDKKGRPVHSDRSWRERIGNAWPPLAAAAIIGNMLMSLLASETVGFLWDVQQTGILVLPPAAEEEHEVA